MKKIMFAILLICLVFVVFGCAKKSEVQAEDKSLGSLGQYVSDLDGSLDDDTTNDDLDITEEELNLEDVL